MHTIGTTLPKLNLINCNLITTPKLRGRYRTVRWIISLQLLEGLLHHSAIDNFTTLRLANPCAYLTVVRTFLKVSGRFIGIDFSNTATDTNLTLKLMPKKQRFSIGVFSDILTLRAFVIGIKHDTGIGNFTQQHNTHARLIVRPACR